RPAGVIVKMAPDQRDINIAALANRLAIVHRFQHCQPSRMLLYLPGHRIEVASSHMRGERLPTRQRSARAAHSSVNVRGRTLCYRGERFSRGGIESVEENSFRGKVKSAVDEMAEPALVTIQPDQCLARVLRRGAILHRQEFFRDTHEIVLTLDPL